MDASGRKRCVRRRTLVNEHNQFTETFPDQLCDIPGTTTVSAVDNFKLYADGTFLDTNMFRQVFTAADSGKSIMIFSAEQAAGMDEPIQNPDGHLQRHLQGDAREAVDPRWPDPVAGRGRGHRHHHPSPHSVTTSSSSSPRPSPASTAHTRTWRAASSCSARYWSRR
jgi:hypothetical protein